MKPLIAIFSCHADIRNGRNQAIRETWADDAKEWFDVRFFVGQKTQSPNKVGVLRDMNLAEDEVELIVYDGNDNLVEKDQAIMTWAVNNGYQNILKTETDVFIHPYRMSKYDFKSHDVIAAWVGTPGERYSGSNRYSFPQGHAIWYTLKAAKYISNELILTATEEMHNSLGETVNHSLRSGDMWSGQVIHKYLRELTVKNDLANFGNGPLTWHCPGSKKGFVPGWLNQMKQKVNDGLL